MGFLDNKYLLTNKSASKIFKSVQNLPIIDPHNHANVAEIAENKNYDNPWQLFAATDHYVWEVLRKRSVPEEFITGSASPEEKWLKMAEVFPDIAGNPVYEWIHLDLKRYLGIDDVLGPKTGAKIWKKATKALAKESMRPQQLLEKIGVEVMCSTDDPADLLDNHTKVNEAVGRTLIRPTWRPDKAMNIFSPAWPQYIKNLGKRFSKKISSLKELLEVLRISHDYFASMGCKASDHGVEKPFSGIGDFEEADKIFKKVIGGTKPSSEECQKFMDFIIGELAELDAEKDWVFQLHIGAVRDIRKSLFDSLGPDSGGDVSDHNIDILTPLKSFLNRFDNRLKVVLYCLEPGHQATLATVARAFGDKVSLGSAWWLCDTPIGMKRQLEYICSVDLFANFAGMVSDSRKLLSYGSRHEMFRRVLCDVIGEMSSKGQMPFNVAEKLAVKICYERPKELFGV